MTSVIEINDQNFEEEVVGSDLPFLLDLSASWCGPCRAIAPTIEKMASDYAGKIRVGKLDIDSNPQVPMRFKVRSVPTLILFSQGEVVGQLIGAHDSSRIVKLIEKSL